MKSACVGQRVAVDVFGLRIDAAMASAGFVARGTVMDVRQGFVTVRLDSSGSEVTVTSLRLSDEHTC